MSGAGDELVGLFYSLVALEQPLSLGELAEGAATRSFPALTTNTPEWFAAAASGSDLLAMAPELQALPPQEEQPSSAPDVDLIHVYAPEMAVLDELEEDEEDTPALPPTPPAPTPAAATQIGLLKELGDLDD